LLLIQLSVLLSLEDVAGRKCPLAGKNGRGFIDVWLEAPEPCMRLSFADRDSERVGRSNLAIG